MIDLLGYAASIAVLATFLMRAMLPLRLIAILSNILFLLYGYCAHIPPVLVLHAALLPINIVRLVTLRERGSSGPGSSPPAIQSLASHPEYRHHDRGHASNGARKLTAANSGTPR
jgi:hypothetical protein